MQLLVLPIWARIGLLLIMFLIVAGGLVLLTTGLLWKEKEDVTAAMTLLTVSLPIMLIVVALVFGQRGAKRLKDSTRYLLETELPETLLANLVSRGNRPAIERNLQGCRCDYRLHYRGNGAMSGLEVNFSVELNVKKINVAFWLATQDLPDIVSIETGALGHFRHVFAGAEAEGYRMNNSPAHYLGTGSGSGVLFSRELDPDFLLKPAARLYLCQDLGFFVRGVVEATYSASKASSQTAQGQNV